MKRPLMYAAGGFVLGEVCLLLSVWLRIGILTSLCVGVCCLWMKDRREEIPQKIRHRQEGRSGKNLLWWILPLFCVLGMWRMQADGRWQEQCQQLVLQAENTQIRLEGEVRKITEKEKSIELRLTAVTVYAGSQKEDFSDVLVYIGKGDESGRNEISRIRMGMQVAVWGQLKSFEQATNPGQFDFAEYYHSLGLEGAMYGEYVQIIDYAYSPYYHWIAQLRQLASTVLARICTGEDLGIFQAVLLGEKTLLDDGVQEMYQRNGIAHLLAVSGLHVSLIGLGCYHLLRKMGLGFDGAGFAAVLVTISYGVLAGGTASVIRAVTMVLFQIAADKLGRTYDLLTAMAFSALWILMESPAILFQAGFQLSFGAILAIGAVNPITARWIGAEKRLEKMVIFSLGIQVVTFPMTAWHFFEYPVYGVLLNLLVIPLMMYVVVSGLAGVGIGMCWAGGGEFAIGTGHYVLVFYEWLCQCVEQLPGAIWIVGRPKLWQIAVYAAFWSVILAGMHWFGNPRRSERKDRETKKENRENTDHPVSGWLRRAVFLFLISVSFVSLRSCAPDGLEAVFLDVGQGDGACFQTRNTVVLVDGGSSDEKQLGEQILEPFLKSRGISRIDYALVSHADQDHISGLTYLLQSCPDIQIAHLVLPWRGKEDEVCGELVRLAEKVGTKVLWIQAGSRIAEPELSIRCLYAGEGLDSQERNEDSPFLEVQYGDVGILLTGDMSTVGEMQWLRQLGQSVESDVQSGLRILKAAHHGSKYSTSEEFLKKIRPELTVISCGEDNSYGHPHQDTLERLEDAGSQVMVTKDCGAVIVEVDETVQAYGFCGR